MLPHSIKITLTLIFVSLCIGMAAAGTISIGSASDAQPQEKVTLPVKITGAEDVVTFGLTVANDVPGVSIRVNKTEQPLGGIYIPTDDESAVSQSMGWMYDGKTPLSGDAVLYYIDVIPSVSGGTIPVKLTIDTVGTFPATAATHEYTAVSGTVTVRGQSSGGSSPVETQAPSTGISGSAGVVSSGSGVSSGAPAATASANVIATTATVTKTRTQAPASPAASAEQTVPVLPPATKSPVPLAGLAVGLGTAAYFLYTSGRNS